MKIIKKVLIIALFFVQSIQFFAKSQNVLDFKEIQRHALGAMKQADGSLIFDGKKDYLKMNNPAYNQEAMAIYMKFRLTSSSFFNRTIELINTADGDVESVYGKWGVSVNYTKDGLWVVSCDNVQGKMTHNFTKFRFVPGVIYELYVYLDGKNVRIYVDGKCISEKRLPYGYYSAHNLYVGAGVLKDSYSAIQVYDFDIFTGKQTAKESEKQALKGNILLGSKVVFSMEDLKPFVHSKQEFTKDLEIKNGSCMTLINPLRRANSFGVYFDFTFYEKTQTLKNILELFNTTNNSVVENGGRWGLSLNYDKGGMWLITNNGMGKTQILRTGVFFRENERYSLFVYIDNCDIYIYVNGKCVKRSVNTNLFYNNATYLHVGAGILVNSYIQMTLHDFKLTNKLLKNKKEIDEMLISLMTSEDEKINTTMIVNEDKKDNFSFKIHKENYVLAGAIASYAVSAAVFTFIPVCFGIYGYNNFMYQESLSRYYNAMYQEELDLYYNEMQQSSFYANAALTSGIVLIPVCALTLTSGIILTVIYQKLKMEHLPKVAFGFIPNQGCRIQFSVPFKG